MLPSGKRSWLLSMQELLLVLDCICQLAELLLLDFRIPDVNILDLFELCHKLGQESEILQIHACE